MAGKRLLEITVALCAFAAVFSHASPLGREELSFPNVTEVLERLEQMLDELEEKIEEVGDEVDSAVETSLAKIEEEADKVVQRWNATVQRWVDIATRDGADIQVCLEGLKPLSSLAQQLEADAKECLDERVGNLTTAVQTLKDMAPEAAEAIQKGAAEIQECLAKNNTMDIAVCLVVTVPKVKADEAKVVAVALVLAGKAGAEAAALMPLTTICTAKATAKRGAEASVIINETVKCIRSAISQ